jgi:hypothetical protein
MKVADKWLTTLIDILEFGVVKGVTVGPETDNRISYFPSVSLIKRTEWNLTCAIFLNIFFSSKIYKPTFRSYVFRLAWEGSIK